MRKTISILAVVVGISGCAQGPNYFEGAVGGAALGAGTGAIIGSVIANGDAAASASLGALIGLPAGLAVAALYQASVINSAPTSEEIEAEILEKARAQQQQIFTNQREIDELRKQVMSEAPAGPSRSQEVRVLERIR